jgi:DNA-binding transcriptional ArsR family regulator
MFVELVVQTGGVPKALPVLDVSGPVCCAPLASGVVDPAGALEVALRLKALADPVRVQLMSILLAQREEGVCTCDLAPAVGLTEATVSHHLKQLREAGLVEGTRKGTNVYYRPQSEALGALCRVIDPTCC